LANQYDTRPIGERNTPMSPSKGPMPPSTIEPLPYFPNLKGQLRGVTASLVLTYLETHHPAPRGPNGAILTTPVTLNLDAVAADLQVTRRTLLVTLSVLCAWWPTEEARSRAASAGREFINPDHTRYGRLKFYSATGSKTWRPGTIIQIRRNFAHLTWLLRQAGIATLTVPSPAIALPVPKLAENGDSAPTAHSPAQKESLSEILLRTSALAWDRRSTRYPRLREAVGTYSRRVRSRSVEMQGNTCRTVRSGDEPGSR
jgi:hypothetical protein